MDIKSSLHIRILTTPMAKYILNVLDTSLIHKGGKSLDT